MSNIVVSLTKVDAKSTLASIRIARFISKVLRLPIKDRSSGEAEKYDTIILVNGPPAFCNWREELAAMVSRCRSLVWVNNDYTIYPPSQVGKVMRARGWTNAKGHIRSPVVWSTIPDKVDADRLLDRYINWNQLTYEEKKIKRGKDSLLLYYGAFRKGREERFARFLSNKNTYPIAISCSKAAAKNFAAINDRAAILPPFESLYDEFGRVGASLYMEDTYSGKHYCSPANRFYECLGAGIPILVDDASSGTFEEAGMAEMLEWSVDSGEDVAKLLKGGTEKIAAKQRKLFGRDYVSELSSTVKKAWRELKKHG